jgi:hypothetical protein
MITLVCLIASGLGLGVFFNGYALAIFCILFALGNFVFAFSVGIGYAATTMVLGLVSLQGGYVVGLSASAYIFLSKPVSAHRS